MQVSMLIVKNLKNRTAKHFAVGLAKSLSVVALKLIGFTISNTGAVSIFRSLEHNTSIKERSLTGNSQLTEHDCEAVGCAIERMMNVNKTLKTLNLGGCRFASEHFTNALARNCSLKNVTLHSNQINSASAVSIFRSLEHNTSLEELDLSENSQLAKGDNEAVGCAIERTLNVNRKLRVLTLRECGLDIAVATHIFRSLEHNPNLEEVDLFGNSQLAEGDDSEAVGCAIERMLIVNKTLKTLNLGGCQVIDPTAEHITSGLTRNTSHVTLDMGSCKPSGSCAVFLLQQVTTHPTLGIVGRLIILGVGELKTDRGAISCVASDIIPEHLIELFRALNDSDMKLSKLEVKDFTSQTTELLISQSVETLDLKQHEISSGVPVDVFTSLEHNTSLVELDLSVNSQLADGDSNAVGCAVERMLNKNRTLKILNLSGCHVPIQ